MHKKNFVFFLRLSVLLIMNAKKTGNIKQYLRQN